MEISSTYGIYNQANESNKNKQENTQSSFSEVFTQINHDNQFKEKEEIEKEESALALLADLFSVIKTGYTQSELAEIQRKIQEIREKMKEDSGKDKVKLEDLIKQIELAVAELQKRVTGESTIEADKETEDSSSEDPMAKLEKRLNKVAAAVEKLALTDAEAQAMIRGKEIDRLKILEELKPS